MSGNIWSEIKKQYKEEPPPVRAPSSSSVSHQENGFNSNLPPGTVTFDLETGSVDDMWRSLDGP